MKQDNQVYWLIFFATLARCVVAATTALGNDEVYYLAYAQHLQWNYFDHPPMVALLIRVTTCNLTLTHEFFIRLGPIIFSAINTWLVYQMAKKWSKPQAGFFAAMLFNASVFCSIIATCWAFKKQSGIVAFWCC
jgi:4-amino-4-deoxy-L-arabinose transferase-like glycosyltransferase